MRTSSIIAVLVELVVIAGCAALSSPAVEDGADKAIRAKIDFVRDVKDAEHGAADAGADATRD